MSNQYNMVHSYKSVVPKLAQIIQRTAFDQILTIVTRILLLLCFIAESGRIKKTISYTMSLCYLRMDGGKK